MGNENTHIANGTGRRVQVFYNTDKMILHEMEVQFSSEAEIGKALQGASGSVRLASNTRMVYYQDTRIHSFSIPAHDFNKLIGEGTIYMSAFYEDTGIKICENYSIPSDRSVILTPEGNVKFQKYGSSLWEDEYGNLYS